MIPYQLFGFQAEFFHKLPEDQELEEFFRVEFGKRPPGWQPRFGRVEWFDADSNRWAYMFLLTGNVPQAKSRADAEKKVHRLTQQLSTGFATAHPNPGVPLPEPLIRIWELEPATIAAAVAALSPQTRTAAEAIRAE